MSIDAYVFQQINPVKDFLVFCISLDISIFNGVNSLAGKFAYLDGLGIFFAEYFGYVLAIAVFLIFWKKWKIIIQIFSAAIFARLIFVEMVRFLWLRPRPFVENDVNLLLDHANTGAFPSGHAAFFFAISIVVYSYNKKAGIGFFAASFLIGLSRVFGGIHWPLDILAGAAVGILSSWLILKIFRKF